jgi:peptidoglycan hydrolase-like protein with peptidoglycan-binding domain
MKRCNVAGYPCHMIAAVDDEEADKDWDDKDRRVNAIQRRLVRAGFLERDDVDGEYGPKTQQAVRRFQRENDLRVTGQVDDRTWDALRAYKRKG